VPPVVVTLPPLIAVVPPISVVRLDAVTPPAKVVVPVLFTTKAPSATSLPMAPVKVTLPMPALTVSALVSPVAELTLLLNRRGLPDVVNAVPVPRVTAPV